MKEEKKVKDSKLEFFLKNDHLRRSSTNDFVPTVFPKNFNIKGNSEENTESSNNKLSVKEANMLNDIENKKFILPKNDIINMLISYFNPDRDRTERERLLISFLSNLFYALANLMMKFISIYYPDANPSTTSLYRFIVMFLLSYIYIANRNIPFLNISEVNSKYILGIRILTAYAISFSFANSTHYLRLGTAISFFFISPIFTSLASIYYFKDKCKTHNVIGLSVCIFAMLMITNSEAEADKENKNLNLGLGIFWGMISLISTVAMIISTKMLVMEIDSINLNYFIGKYSTLIGFIICVVTNNLFYLYPGYILLTSLNGLLFWCALYFMNISLKINNLIAVSCIGFLSLVYAFGFGLIFFGEKLRFVDIIACFIIFGFNFFTVLYPNSQDINSLPNINVNKNIEKIIPLNEK